MWDSARKPTKIRSVLQSNGMRHFVVNEETDEVYSNILHQQQKRKPSSSKVSQGVVTERNGNSDQHRQQSHNHSEKHEYAYDESQRTEKIEYSEGCPTQDTCEKFFGVAGNKISNSKKHKVLQNRYFQQLPQVKENSFSQLHKSNSVTSRCPHLKIDMLDLVPVKSPVIKKLINGKNSGGGAGSSSSSFPYKESSQGTSSSTTLCSRIMTWIDLEVKKNAVKGKSSNSLPFTSADLSIVNELNHLEPDSSSASSPTDSGSTTPSGEGVSTSSSTNSFSSSTTVSFPKLVPCWRKDSKEFSTGAASKAKKSVRISEDLPRWGKMKRRLKKQDRSYSLNELYHDEELTSPIIGRDLRLETNYGSRSKLNCRKQSSSVISLSGGQVAESAADAPSKEESSFVVCDENLPTTGRLHVHIFLPQTDNSTACGKVEEGRTCDNESNLSGRSEDSTT